MDRARLARAGGLEPAWAYAQRIFVVLTPGGEPKYSQRLASTEQSHAGRGRGTTGIGAELPDAPSAGNGECCPISDLRTVQHPACTLRERIAHLPFFSAVHP